MLVFQYLNSLLETIINWENQLKDFYDVAEIALRSKESKNVIVILRENHVNNLQIIKGIHVEDFGKNEIIKYAPDYHDKELIPIGKIKRDSTPKDIYKNILEYESKLREFYAKISENIITRNQKELFNSFVMFKERQIFEIKQFMEFL